MLAGASCGPGVGTECGAWDGFEREPDCWAIYERRSLRVRPNRHMLDLQFPSMSQPAQPSPRTEQSAPNGEERRPLILVVDDEEAARERIVRALERRYGDDYRIVAHRSSAAALDDLRRLRDVGQELALALVDQWIPGSTGGELLAALTEVFPLAKRGLLVDWGAWGDDRTAKAIVRGMTRGDIDYYVIKPWRSPDELFHRTVVEFLYDWTKTADWVQQAVTVVGSERSVRIQGLRTLLTRNGIPFAFRSSDSPEGARIIAESGVADPHAPVVRMLDGRVLVNPSRAELAEAYGTHTSIGPSDEYDLVVVGAGPAGLATAVYGASEGLHTLVVESEAIGGQAGSSSLIRNYLGFARGISGAELAQRAYQQAWVFGTRFLFMRRVTRIEPEHGKHLVCLSEGTKASARAVVLATGVSYRRLSVPELEDFTGAGVFYGASTAEAEPLRGGRVYVVGGGNSAGQAALHLCRYARRVTLLVRGASVAASMSKYLCDQIEATEKVDIRFHTDVVGGGGTPRLEWLTLRDRQSGERATVEADGLFVLIGAHPRAEWLPPEVERDAWGYVPTGTDLAGGGRDSAWPLGRPPFMLETSLPRVFAVGDLRRGSVKRVAAAVGEGSVVVQQVHNSLVQEPATHAAVR